MGSCDFEDEDSMSGFLRFCRTIRYTPPISIELIVQSTVSTPRRDVQEVLRPLRLLRNVRSFIVRESLKNELPDNIRLRDVQIPSRKFYVDLEARTSFKQELSELVRGNTPVEFLTDMHNCLVSYFIAFERYEKLRYSLKFSYVWKVEDNIPFDDAPDSDLVEICTNAQFKPVHTDLLQ